MLPATSSNVCVITCRSSSGLEDTAIEPAFSIIARYSERADDSHELAIEEIEDRLRRAGAGADTEPAEAHEIDAALGERRNAGQILQSLRRRDREDFEQLLFVLRDDRQRRRDVEVHATRHQLLHDLRAAAERDPIHADAGELLELPRQDLLRGAGADGGIGHLARMRLGILHEGLEIGRGNRIR